MWTAYLLMTAALVVAVLLVVVPLRLRYHRDPDAITMRQFASLHDDIRLAWGGIAANPWVRGRWRGHEFQWILMAHGPDKFEMYSRVLVDLPQAGAEPPVDTSSVELPAPESIAPEKWPAESVRFDPDAHRSAKLDLDDERLHCDLFGAPSSPSQYEYVLDALVSVLDGDSTENGPRRLE